MLSELKKLEKEGMAKLFKRGWTSVDVDYHPPKVERVWTQIGLNRVYLHVIHPCEKEEALYHPHPWKSAMHIIQPQGIETGIYEMGIGGWFNGIETYCTMEFHGEGYYEMVDKNGFHYVRPVDKPIYSIMLAGPKIWNENHGDLKQKLNPLKPERTTEILNIFKKYYNIK